MFANILLIIASIAIAITLVCAVAILVIFAYLLVQMDKEENSRHIPHPEPVFYGKSRLELEATTARLLREDKRRPRKRHAQVMVIR